MSTRRLSVDSLMNGGLEIALAVALALIATVAHLGRGRPIAAVIDLVAYACAALAVRWPRTAGIALGTAMSSLLLSPDNWFSMGEYACLIAILGAGIRGRKRQRTVMTFGYGPILIAIVIQSAPGDPAIPFAIALWVVLVAAAWGIGSLFNAYRVAQAAAQSAALKEQRLAVARDLHDTVARDLTRASLRAQTLLATAPAPAPEWESVAADVQQASAQLRWMLGILREPAPTIDSRSPTPAASGEVSLSETLTRATQALRRSGFAVTATAEGELAAVPAAILPTLRAVIGEACANIERHGDPQEPVVIMIAVGESVDAVFINRIRGHASPAGRGGAGLVGLRERLTQINGQLNTEQEGEQWVTRVAIPL